MMAIGALSELQASSDYPGRLRIPLPMEASCPLFCNHYFTRVKGGLLKNQSCACGSSKLRPT